MRPLKREGKGVKYQKPGVWHTPGLGHNTCLSARLSRKPCWGRRTELSGEMEYIQSLEGKTVQVTIGKVKGPRIAQQMRCHWSVVVTLIADYTSDDIGTIHEFLKEKFMPKQTITVEKETRIVPGCTHNLCKDNFFEDYVGHIRRWAAQELQITIPDPNQVQP
jgi:hypothetical protein